MALICDTSGLVAYFDRSDKYHSAVSDAIESDYGPFIISPYVVAELDYIVVTRRGIDAEIAMLEELSSDAWKLATFDASAIASARQIVERYRDQKIGLTDASLSILADVYHTSSILTLDRRHFSVIRPASGKAFQLLPAKI